MTDQSPESEPDPSRSLTLLDVGVIIVDNLLLVAAVVIGLAFGVAAFLGIELPRNLRTIGIFAAIGAPLIGNPISARVVDLLYSPNYRYLVDLKAEDPSSGSIIRMRSEWYRQNMTVIEGEVDWVNPSVGFARDVDLEAGTCRGVWRGTLSDRQLMTALAEVRKCKGQLQEDARRGFAIRSQAVTIVRNAARSIGHHIVATVQTGELPDRGEGLDHAVEDAIESMDFSQDLDDLDDLEDAADDDDASLSVDVEVSEPVADPDATADSTEAPADD
jgi:hypothetical protein